MPLEIILITHSGSHLSFITHTASIFAFPELNSAMHQGLLGVPREEYGNGMILGRSLPRSRSKPVVTSAGCSSASTSQMPSGCSRMIVSLSSSVIGSMMVLLSIKCLYVVCFFARLLEDIGQPTLL